VAVITVVGLLWPVLQPAVLASVPRFLGGLPGPGGPMPRPWDPSDATKPLHRDSLRWPGGFWILLYSYWLREKGSGMARTSGASPDRWPESPSRYRPTAWLPSDDAETRVRWHAWRRYLTIDALVGICGNLATTLMTCLLPGRSSFPKGCCRRITSSPWWQSRFFEGELGTDRKGDLPDRRGRLSD